MKNGGEERAASVFEWPATLEPKMANLRRRHFSGVKCVKRMNLVGPQHLLHHTAYAHVRNARLLRHFSHSAGCTPFGLKDRLMPRLWHSGCWRQTVIKKSAHVVGQLLYERLGVL